MIWNRKSQIISSEALALASGSVYWVLKGAKEGSWDSADKADGKD